MSTRDLICTLKSKSAEPTELMDKFFPNVHTVLTSHVCSDVANLILSYQPHLKVHINSEMVRRRRTSHFEWKGTYTYGTYDWSVGGWLGNVWLTPRGGYKYTRWKRESNIQWTPPVVCSVDLPEVIASTILLNNICKYELCQRYDQLRAQRGRYGIEEDGRHTDDIEQLHKRARFLTETNDLYYIVVLMDVRAVCRELVQVGRDFRRMRQ